MLHDISLALGGVGGGVLKSILNDEIVSMSFAIHPCERYILVQVINIADDYKTIQNFIKKVPHFGSERIVLDNGVEISQGLYLRAFCDGVYDCLEPYRKNVVRVESETLQNADQTITGILAQVAPFTPLLTALNSVINQIVARQLHGCRILQLVHEHLSSGIEMVDEAMARIMQACHMVMLKQLTSILLYGRLNDPHKEFFIEEHSESQEAHYTSSVTISLDCQSQPEIDVNKPDVPGKAITDYRIVQEMVPCYIPPSVPEKTKFIGSTVVLFSQNPRSKESGTDVQRYQSVYDKMESSLLSQLNLLQNVSALDMSSKLESAVDNIQSCVTQHMFSLAKDDANFRAELELIKDYFLLGRGELFVVFLRKARSILLKPVANNHTGRDLNSLLYLSVRNVHLNSDLIMEKFSLKVPFKDKPPMAPPDSIVWKVMELKYQPPWPLGMLFTSDVLRVYDKIFNFLLQVKMAELNLHNVWIENIKRKDNMDSPQVWVLRNTLLYLIGNLQCYLHLDVIESRYSIMCKELDETRDFQQVVHHHSKFLSNVAAETFVDTHAPQENKPVKLHPVSKCLMHILHLCDDFCAEIAKDDIEDKVLKRISSQLNTNIGVLMNLISVLGNKATGLRLLLLRLDYNKYFSNLLYLS